MRQDEREAGLVSSPLVVPEEFPRWILFEDENLLVLNKPGWLVCHPSKNGPWSSLVGAAREYCGAERLYLAGRLDRETSGVVVLGKNASTGKSWQRAVEKRETIRIYLAVLEGELAERTEVDTHLGNDPDSPVYVKQRVTSSSRKSKRALTTFDPLVTREGLTLARVLTGTGRKHQIRVHAQWLGCPLAGEKLYGRDENLYLKFCEGGWTEELAGNLAFSRQALHGAVFGLKNTDRIFTAPLPSDLKTFCREGMSLSEAELKDVFAEAVSLGGA